MKRQAINEDMKVWDVIQDHPETYGVFRQYGCPDIHKSIFQVSSHFMKLRVLAHSQHINLDDLLRSLNKAVVGEEKGSTAIHN